MENNDYINFTNRIIYGWNGKLYEVDSVDEYASEYPNKVFLIDLFPSVINNPIKYDQVSVFYRKWIDGNISKRVFLRCEKQYIEFIKTLWLYNDVDICFSLSIDNYFRKGLKRLKKRRDSVTMENVIQGVTSWEVIEQSLSLALREAGFLWLYFRDWEILATINDFCILIVVKDDMIKTVLERLLVVNHLYMHEKLGSDSLNYNNCFPK